MQHECLGLSRFAFEQLIMMGEYGKLLRLGEEFPEDLAHFLKETGRIDLSWLHHIYLKDYFSASDTLHALALSPSTPPQPKRKNLPSSLSQRKHFLYLSKIAALAGDRNHTFFASLPFSIWVFDTAQCSPLVVSLIFFR
jgi:nuclear pore complex protein Nup133